jgi:hypothetical protein
MYWRIGNRINSEILGNQRAEYGKQIVATLSRQLTIEYGRSYEEKNLRRMIQFANQFSDIENVATLWRQLSGSHFKILIPIKTSWKEISIPNVPHRKQECRYAPQKIIKDILRLRVGFDVIDLASGAVIFRTFEDDIENEIQMSTER